jgi:DNA-binding transcriptional LysR family regulator
MVSKNRTIETQSLQIFLQVARLGGVTAAAEALGMAKSAVSKQLTGLEAVLNVRLFERHSRRVLLTREGDLLLPRAESIVAEMARLTDEALEGKTRTQGTVRISASPEFGAFLASSFLPILMASHPHLKVLMRLEYEQDDLHDPAIDLAFRLGSMADDRLVGRHIGEFARVLVCSPAFAKAHPVKRPEDLEALPALLFSDRDLRARWVLQHTKKATQQVSLNVSASLGIRGFSALLGAARAGLGIARLPLFVAAPALANGEVVQVLPAWKTPPANVFVAYRTGVIRIARVRAVIDLAIQELPTLLKPVAL